MTLYLPVSSTPFFAMARKEIERIAKAVPLTTAILDNWNTQEGQRTVRVIYSGSFTQTCESQCEACPLFQTVGEDLYPKDIQEPNFVTSLCEATNAHHELFTPWAVQRFLNCKTSAQYEEAYVRYVLVVCLGFGKLLAELLWIKEFRLLLYPGCETQEDLFKEEWLMKERIIEKILQGIQSRGEEERREWVQTLWRFLRSPSFFF